MGFSHKSHGKRSDKETQSPMLKIFKDMMHKEKHDPEKTNLLKDKHVERKRKHYSGSRSKSGHKTMDSSSSEHRKHPQPYITGQQDMRNAEYDVCRTQSIPFQNEKRESWWFWGEKAESPEAKSKCDETCSCGSCALKKIISTEYACIGCLTVLFAISVIVAAMLVYKSVPCMSTDYPTKDYNKIKLPKFEDRLKRKTDGGGWNIGAKKSWFNPFSRSQAPSFGSFKIEDVSLVESENELSKILDADKMQEIQNSDRLRDFYKKLLQTDAAIRTLRKNLNENSMINANRYDDNNNIDFSSQNDFNSQSDINSQIDIGNSIDFNNNPDRTKRSIFHRPRVFYFKKRDRITKPIIDKGKLVTKTTVTMTTNKKTSKPQRNKRFGRFNDTEGFVIEKNQVVIQYKPIPNRLVAKCSHTPKDSNSHETQMKHPFYKNTQRLDELLDQFMDKRLPNLLTGFDMNTINDQKKKCKHPQTEQTVAIKTEEQNSVKEQEVHIEVPAEKKVLKEEPKVESTESSKTEDTFENDFFDDSEGVDKKKEEKRTSSPYDILLSISTVLNDDMQNMTNFPASVLIDRVPNLRKLMQVDVKEDQGIGYEDFKEVLADDKDCHDDNDKESNRKKRDDEIHMSTLDPEAKHYPTGVNNPNWKGPLPLYPEELNQMIKQGPYSNNKVEIPVHNMDSAPETDDSEFVMTDVQYIEDYLDNGYEKLVELAQAYSDYGVLDEKKDLDADKKVEDKGEHELDDREVKKSNSALKHELKHGIHKKKVFGRPKKATAAAEGIRIEIHPTTSAREDHPSDLYKLLQKHVKITNFPHDGKPHRFNSFLPIPTSANLNEFRVEAPKLREDNRVKNLDTTDNSVIFTVNKKRTLKSIDLKNNLNDVNNDRTGMADSFGNFEVVMGKFKRDTDKTLQKEVKSSNESAMVNIDDITLKSKYENLTKEKDDLKQKLANDMTISDFFMLLSNWFSALDAAEVSKQKMPASGIIPREQGTILEKRYNTNVTTETILPQYDSDMIENIGHRSRVLLSVDENNNITKVDNDLNSDEDEVQNAESSSSTEPLNNLNMTHTIQDTTPSITKEDTNETNTKSHNTKRQATDDSNLIFWNDLYDDEYGIKVDPFENNIRDKHSANRNDFDFLRKSNSWLQDKVKTFTNKLNMGYFRKDGKRRISRQAKWDGKENAKRVARSLEDEEEAASSSKIDFAALTAKMKEVCKKTAKIVQQTKTVQVREENKDDHVATSLMQQLVRLMTDLVDFQVQERTCRKLPPDLQDFLEWLTSPKPDEDSDSERFSPEIRNFDQQHLTFDKSTEREEDLLQPSERENADSKTDCLGTLHVVQDLIQQYDHMSDDDKSVMPGVKTYLENQMDYLQRQISTIDEQNPYSKDARFRRDAVTCIRNKVADAIDVTAKTVEHQYKNLKHMYHKYMGKMKHVSKQVTKTTASIKESASTICKKIEEVTKRKHQHKTHKPKDKCKVVHGKQNVEEAHAKDQKVYIHPKKHKDKYIKNKDHNKNVICQNSIVHNKDKMQMHAKEKDSVTHRNKLDVERNANEKYSESRFDRNIKDVYFKAVEEANKETTENNSQKRDSDPFERAEILSTN